MRPAEQLDGITLENGWKVTKKATRKPNATGGHFSVGYLAEHRDGTRGFLKAMDYTRALESDNPANVLLAMTHAYVFEKKICQKCAHLSKIARALDSGVIDVDSSTPFSKVEYLIFELAEEDVRSHLDAAQNLDAVFAVRTLHHVATGLKQLHTSQLAHQDLKPSNVLMYQGGDASKICDLGRGWDQNDAAPHDDYPIAGDRTYAPVEALYGLDGSDHRLRRFGCDLYHLGSLAVFLFSRVHMNSLLFDNILPEHRPFMWKGTYGEVLPYLQASWEIALQQLSEDIPRGIRDELVQAVDQLCNPDTNRRGHPANRNANQFSLERFISLFDKLAYRAEIGIFKAGLTE